MSVRVDNRIVLVGAGGHAKVVIEVIRAAGTYQIIGLIDEAKKGAVVLGVPVVGGDDLLPGLRESGLSLAAIAIGSNETRQRLGNVLCDLGFHLPPIVHPTAVISPSAILGAGVVAMVHAIVGTESKVNDLAIINTAAVIDHDNFIGSAAHVAPGCALAGNVRVGARSMVGIGTSVRDGVTIGDDVVIGAGSAVITDIADKSIVAGVPTHNLR